MNVDLQTLAIVSVLTTATTEVIKNICKKTHREYESNLIAMAISVLLSLVLIIVKPICLDGATLTPAMFYNFLVMAFFGMLAANLEFDKIKELILALRN